MEKVDERAVAERQELLAADISEFTLRMMKTRNQSADELARSASISKQTVRVFINGTASASIKGLILLCCQVEWSMQLHILPHGESPTHTRFEEAGKMRMNAINSMSTELLRYLRDNNTTIRALASRADVTQSTVEAVFYKQSLPAFKTLVRLCAAIDMDLRMTFAPIGATRQTDSVQAMAAAANAAKMTYGQYVAMRHEQQKNKGRP